MYDQWRYYRWSFAKKPAMCLCKVRAAATVDAVVRKWTPTNIRRKMDSEHSQWEPISQDRLLRRPEWRRCSGVRFLPDQNIVMVTKWAPFRYTWPFSSVLSVCRWSTARRNRLRHLWYGSLWSGCSKCCNAFSSPIPQPGVSESANEHVRHLARAGRPGSACWNWAVFFEGRWFN